jgi:hypothetical protein
LRHRIWRLFACSFLVVGAFLSRLGAAVNVLADIAAALLSWIRLDSFMSDEIENSSPPNNEAPGSFPLRNARREMYCRERALCSSPLLAYRAAGFKSCDNHAARGNAVKLERSAAVRDRIAYLTRQDEDVIRAKREKLEGYLFAVHNFDIADYYVDVERPLLTKDGDPVLGRDGKPILRTVQELRPFSDLAAEQRAIIQGLKYTDSGRPILELGTKMQANIELRKMHGIGAAAKSIGDEFSSMSMDELKAFIAREQITLGITELVRRASAGAGTSSPEV